LICKRHSRDFVKYTQTIIYYTGSIVFLLLINNNNIYIMLESFKTLIIILLLIIVFSLSHNSPEGKISAWNNVLLNFSHFFPNLSSFFFYNNSLISWSFSILFTPMDSPRLDLRLTMIDSRRPQVKRTIFILDFFCWISRYGWLIDLLTDAVDAATLVQGTLDDRYNKV
jgi:hypothetical protein